MWALKGFFVITFPLHDAYVSLSDSLGLHHEMNLWWFACMHMGACVHVHVPESVY